MSTRARLVIRAGAGAALICAAAATALLGAGPASAASGDSSGTAHAIAFARSVQSAYSRVPGVTFTRQGYAGLQSSIGRVSMFNATWGRGFLPSGWVDATEHAVVALHDGDVVWASETLSPPRCSDLGCSTVPVEIVETSAGSFFRFDVHGTRFACYDKLSSQGLAFAVGSSFLAIDGDYAPLVRSGDTVVSRFTYPWVGNRTATETDTISASTRLIGSYKVAVTKGSGTDHRAFSFTAQLTTLTREPDEPKLDMCL